MRSDFHDSTSVSKRPREYDNIHYSVITMITGYLVSFVRQSSHLQRSYHWPPAKDPKDFASDVPVEVTGNATNSTGTAGVRRLEDEADDEADEPIMSFPRGRRLLDLSRIVFTIKTKTEDEASTMATDLDVPSHFRWRVHVLGIRNELFAGVVYFNFNITPKNSTKKQNHTHIHWPFQNGLEQNRGCLVQPDTSVAGDRCPRSRMRLPALSRKIRSLSESLGAPLYRRDLILTKTSFLNLDHDAK